jgi:hypothetical protein
MPFTWSPGINKPLVEVSTTRGTTALVYCLIKGKGTGKETGKGKGKEREILFLNRLGQSEKSRKL